MKILTITAHYPPYHFGGYELRIKDIMDGLAAKGHIIQVLTTVATKAPQINSSAPSYPILRKLHNRDTAKFFPKEILFDLLDTRTLEKQITEFKPDLIYLGHIYVLSKALLPYLARLNTPLVLDEGGASLKGAWTDHGRWFRFTGDYGEDNLIIHMLKPLVIKFICWLSKGRVSPTWRWPDHINVIYNNKLNMEKSLALGMPVRSAKVVYSGVDTNLFSFEPREKLNETINIIYPGRFEPLKGQLDAVKLIDSLREVGMKARLLLIGPTFSNEYLAQVKDRILENHLKDQVEIKPMVSQKELIKHYHEADICFFPTYHQMGFSRVPLEAMACGCLVISYGNEGSSEIIKDHQTGFIVPEDEIFSIVQIIQGLFENTAQIPQLTFSAHEMVDNDFSINNYINQIEDTLIGHIQDNYE